MLKLFCNKFINDQRGSSELLGTAAGLIIIMILIGGVLQLSMIPIAKIMVRQAAYESVRQGAKSSDPVTTATSTAYAQFAGLPNWKVGGNVVASAQLVGTGVEQILQVNLRYRVPVLNDRFVNGASGGFVWIDSGNFQERIQEGDI